MPSRSPSSSIKGLPLSPAVSGALCSITMNLWSDAVHDHRLVSLPYALGAVLLPAITALSGAGVVDDHDSVRSKRPGAFSSAQSSCGIAAAHQTRRQVVERPGPAVT